MVAATNKSKMYISFEAAEKLRSVSFDRAHEVIGRGNAAIERKFRLAELPSPVASE